jgi:hypothetical protein
MLAYKFRSIEQLHYVFDIILNNRLYCADWRKLNDPAEGMFRYSNNSNDKKDCLNKVMEIAEKKRKYRICSLLKTFDSHLLWAHYASGFQGFAIEVDLPCHDNNIKQVRYRGVFADVLIKNYIDPDKTARNILFSKYFKWKYEQEIRILQEGEWYELKPEQIKKIIVGSRIEKSVLEAFKIICKSKEIELYIIRIGDKRLHIDPII